MKKIFAKLHLWLAIPFGVIIAIVCITGSVLSFESEITEMMHPERYFVENPGVQPLPLDQLMKSARMQTKGQEPITSVQISKDPKRTYQFNTAKRGLYYFANPYTAEIAAIQKEREPFFLTTMKLHRWLLDGMKPGGEVSVGKLIVGISVLAMVFLLISGLVLWMPANKKILLHRLKLPVGKGIFATMHSWHVSGGFYTALVLLILSLTGLTWSFGWYRTAFYKVLGSEAPAGKHAPAKPEDKTAISREGKSSGKPSGRPEGKPEGESATGRERPGGQRPQIEWSKALEAIKTASPTYLRITIESGSASVATSNYGNVRASDKYTFDPATGEIIKTELYKDAPRASKIRGWIYSVHVGAFGGLATRIIACLASLFGAFLAISGYYLWIRRLLRQRR